MKVLLRIFAVSSALILTVSTVYCQKDSTSNNRWSGSASFTGGYNYSKSPWKEMIPDLVHQSADIKLNLKYLRQVLCT